MEDSDFLISKQNYEVTLMKTVSFWPKERHMEWQNRTESPGMYLHIESIDSDKDANKFYWRKDSKDSLFNKCYWTN